MDNIKEVRYFECTCSRCGKVVKNKRGLADLRINGWKQIGEMLLCQNCYAPYANLNPQIGDKVKCLLTTDTWHRTEFGKTYTVCALVKTIPEQFILMLGTDGSEGYFEVNI